MRWSRRTLVIRAQRSFYRSQVVRLGFLLTGLFIAYALSPFAPPALHTAPSLVLIHQALPWWLMSVPFLIYTGLLVWGTDWCAAIAAGIGLVLYLIETTALFVVGFRDDLWNPIGISAFLLTCLLHYAALRLAIIDWARARAGLR